MKFRVTKSAAAAGWRPAVGDALRALGNAIGAMMLFPVLALTGPGVSAPLFRIRVGKRVSVLEVRRHDASRCTRGRWLRLDSGDTPRNAKGWGELAEFWAWYAAEVAEGRTPEWSWLDDPNKNFNDCRTRADANRLLPAPSGGFPSGKTGGTFDLHGRKGRHNPSRSTAWGYAPASGHRIAQTTVDAAAERNQRKRAAYRRRASTRALKARAERLKARGK